MKTLVLVFHPNLNNSRANKALAGEIETQSNVTVHRVYDKYPNGDIDVEYEQSLLLDHDRIILQFPFYWYSTPSLLKQWEDDVLVHGWAHGSKGNKLHGKELLVVVTTGANEEFYSVDGVFKYTVEELLRPLQATSNLIGTQYLVPFVIYGGNKIPENELDQRVKDYVSYALSTDAPLATTR